MVTHDAVSASCCSRVVFLRDGRICLELRRGNRDRRSFYRDVVRASSGLEGGLEDAV